MNSFISCADLFPRGVAFIALLLICSGVAHAQASATWTGATDGDWNTAGNWTAGGPPNGAGATATFDTSATTALSLSASTEVAGIVFNPGASGFAITSGSTLTLTLSGAGIANNSGSIQHFATTASGGNLGTVAFTNNATAGSLTVFTSNGATTAGGASGLIQFTNNATAANGSFTANGATANGNGGNIRFKDGATAGNGTFTTNAATVTGIGGTTQFEGNATAGNGTFTTYGNGNVGGRGTTSFIQNSTAGSGTFTTHGATLGGLNSAGGLTLFQDTATAGAGSFTINAGTGLGGAKGGLTQFQETATAGNATFTVNGATMASGAQGGVVVFKNSATAANATIAVNGGTVSDADGGHASFSDTATAGNATLIANGGLNGGAGGVISLGFFSSGGTARVQVYGNGSLASSGSSQTIGSLEGDGTVSLIGSSLTVGGNNLSTVFSGVVAENGGGSLVKVGAGALTLSGANTYTGGTTVSAGTLRVSNTGGSGIGTGALAVQSGATLGGTGFLDGAVTIESGAHLAPGNSPGTLTLTNGLTLAAGAVLDFELGSTSDRILVTGGNFNASAGTATFNFSGAAGFGPGAYTLIDWTGATPDSFTAGNFAIGSLQYGSSGDYSFSIVGNTLQLTATAIPEPATYAALLSAGALGLVILRRRSRRA